MKNGCLPEQDSTNVPEEKDWYRNSEEEAEEEEENYGRNYVNINYVME